MIYRSVRMCCDDRHRRFFDKNRPLGNVVRNRKPLIDLLPFGLPIFVCLRGYIDMAGFCYSSKRNSLYIGGLTFSLNAIQ